MVPSTVRSGRAPFGSSPVERDVDRDRAVLHGGIDARDLALDDPVARVDFRDLPDQHVLRLRLRHAHDRLQLPRLGDARQVRAGRHLLPDLDRDLLQHPAMPARTFSASTCSRSHARLRPRLVDRGRLHRQLRDHGLARTRQPLLLDAVAVPELGRRHLRHLPGQVGHQPLLRQLAVRVRPHLRLREVGLDLAAAASWSSLVLFSRTFSSV